MFVLVDKSNEGDLPNMYLTNKTVEPIFSSFELTGDVSDAMKFETEEDALEMEDKLGFGFEVEVYDE